ncbi:MAG: enoyl-CoA hydratase/isomerase family protein [Candidatus Jordarchaeum sp.]|uniref:enoyl-CoA hydratase/isomerase family protein n=1 Tax=Candidatus Jordarchaeum sp. TaxID=2823881 RepID=UPI00404AABFF
MKQMFETILYEVQEGVATITLNRPEVLNAFNTQMNQDLKLALMKTKENENVRAIIITGAGRGFCSGADVKSFADGVALESFKKMVENEELMDLLISPYDLVNVEKPIIAAVNGVAVGFGMNLCINCDIIIASENASFGEFFVRMGILPDMNGCFILPRILGIHKAKELIFTGDRIDAKEAERIGLVNKVVPHEELMPTVKALAKKLAESAPLAIGMAKRLIHEGYGELFSEMLKQEIRYQAKLYASEDHMEAALAFFEKRKPRFKGK